MKLPFSDKAIFWALVIVMVAVCVAITTGMFHKCPDAPVQTYYDGLKFGMERQRAFDALCLWGNPTPEQIDSAATAMCKLFNTTEVTK